MPIKLKANNGNIDLTAPVKQVGGGAVDSVNGMTGDVVLEIPSKTSELVNDSGFITEHQSLAEYAKKSELFSKDYNDLTNKPTIPSIDGLASTSYVDSKVAEIDVPTKTSDLINDSGFLTEHQSLSNYYTKPEVDALIPTDTDTFYVEVVDNKVTTPIAEYYAAFQEGKRVVLNNFTSNFGTEYNYVLTYCTSAGAKFCSVFPNYTSGVTDGIQLRFATVSSDGTINVKYFIAANKTDLNDYYTKSQVNAKIPSQLSQLTDNVGYALKTEIPDVSGFITEIPSEYVTETELDAKGYLTEHQDLSTYALKTEIPDVSAYQTEEQVLALIQANLPASGEEVSY